MITFHIELLMSMPEGDGIPLSFFVAGESVSEPRPSPNGEWIALKINGHLFLQNTNDFTAKPIPVAPSLSIGAGSEYGGGSYCWVQSDSGRKQDLVCSVGGQLHSIDIPDEIQADSTLTVTKIDHPLPPSPSQISISYCPLGGFSNYAVASWETSTSILPTLIVTKSSQQSAHLIEIDGLESITPTEHLVLSEDEGVTAFNLSHFVYDPVLAPFAGPESGKSNSPSLENLELD